MPGHFWCLSCLCSDGDAVCARICLDPCGPLCAKAVHLGGSATTPGGAAKHPPPDAQEARPKARNRTTEPWPRRLVGRSPASEPSSSRGLQHLLQGKAVWIMSVGGSEPHRPSCSAPHDPASTSLLPATRGTCTQLHGALGRVSRSLTRTRAGTKGFLDARSQPKSPGSGGRPAPTAREA